MSIGNSKGKERKKQIKEQAENHKKSEEQRKWLNGSITRREWMTYTDQLTTHLESAEKKVQNLMQQSALMNVTMHSVKEALFAKQLITPEEFEDIAKKEMDRFNIVQEIQSGEGDYKARLDKCKEVDIQIEDTILPEQIREDNNLTDKEKKEFFEQYNISEKEPIEEKVVDK